MKEMFAVFFSHNFCCNGPRLCVLMAQLSMNHSLSSSSLQYQVPQGHVSQEERSTGGTWLRRSSSFLGGKVRNAPGQLFALAIYPLELLAWGIEKIPFETAVFLIIHVCLHSPVLIAFMIACSSYGVKKVLIADRVNVNNPRKESLLSSCDISLPAIFRAIFQDIHRVLEVVNVARGIRENGLSQTLLNSFRGLVRIVKSVELQKVPHRIKGVVVGTLKQIPDLTICLVKSCSNIVKKRPLETAIFLSFLVLFQFHVLSSLGIMCLITGIKKATDTQSNGHGKQKGLEATSQMTDEIPMDTPTTSEGCLLQLHPLLKKIAERVFVKWTIDQMRPLLIAIVLSNADLATYVLLQAALFALEIVSRYIVPSIQEVKNQLVTEQNSSMARFLHSTERVATNMCTHVKELEECAVYEIANTAKGKPLETVTLFTCIILLRRSFFTSFGVECFISGVKRYRAESVVA